MNSGHIRFLLFLIGGILVTCGTYRLWGTGTLQVNSIETILSGIMFFLGICFVISIKQAVGQFDATQSSWENRPPLTPTQRLRALFSFVISILVWMIVLPRLPASYVSSASLGFDIGIAFAILMLILQKKRVASS